MQRLGLLMLIPLIILGGAAAAVAAESEVCASETEPPSAVIAACTRLIEGGALAGKELASAFGHRARAFHRDQNLARALSDYSTWIERDPGNARAYVNRAYAHSHMGKLELAFADLDKAIALEPRFADGYLVRATFLVAYRDQCERAMADFTTAIAIAPSRAIAYVGRGQCHARQRQFDRALADLDRAIDLEPGNADHYVGRAAILAGKGDRPGAVADYRKALALDPSRSVLEAVIRDLEGRHKAR